MANVVKNYEKFFTGATTSKTFMNNYKFLRLEHTSLAHTFLLEGSLTSMSVDPTGTYLLGGSETGNVVLYDIARISKSVNCQGLISLARAFPNKPSPSPMDVNWFPGNEGLFSTLSCGTIKLYDANRESDDPIDVIDTGTNSKQGTRSSLYEHHPSNTAHIICMSDCEIRLYDLRVGHFVQTLQLPSKARRFNRIAVNKESPYSLAAAMTAKHSSIGETYIVEYDGRNWNHSLRTYKDKTASGLKSKRKQESEFSHTRLVSFLKYTSDGQHLISHDMDGVIKKWCTNRGSVASVTSVPGRILYNPNVPSMAVIETNPMVVAAPRKDGIYLIDIGNQRAILHLKGHVSPITDMAYDPAFNRLYSVGKENMLLVWESLGTATHDMESLKGAPKIVQTKVLFDNDSESE